MLFQHFGRVQFPILIQVELIDNLKRHLLDGRILTSKELRVICVDTTNVNVNGTLTTFHLHNIGLPLPM